jgi:flavin-dependent thymidylate synthase
MKNTIKSSWEFLEFLFLIEDVSRAFTHQLVRHRIGTKFAQQSQRTVDMGGFDFVMPPPGVEDEEVADVFMVACSDIDDAYQRLVQEMAVKPQDARALLPTNVSTNINFGTNLRTLHDMARLRLCTKTQGEFQDVFRAIRAEVARALPWAATVLQVECCWSGTCAFPTFPTEDCELKHGAYDASTGQSYGGGMPLTLVQLREIDATRGKG